MPIDWQIPMKRVLQVRKLSFTGLALWLFAGVTLSGLGDEQDAGGEPQLSTQSQEAALLERGETIYVTKCAECHGANGQGVETAYEDPLIGDDSIGELAVTVDETMPEEDPEAVVGKDANAVAAYMHTSFYSEAARIRNRPPRIGLTR